MSRGRFICVVGIDGSGKTTLTQGLVERFARQGVDGVYVWCRFESRLLAAALRLYHRLFSRRGRPEYGQTVARKKRVFSAPVIGWLYERFVIFSYTRQIRRLVVRPLRQGKTVFCDRYVYDSVVDLALDRQHSPQKVRQLTERFLRWAPRPDLVLHVDVDPAIAFARKGDVPHISYLTDRDAHYRAIAREFGFVRVDGARPPAEVLAEAERLAQKAVLP